MTYSNIRHLLTIMRSVRCYAHGRGISHKRLLSQAHSACVRGRYQDRQTVALADAMSAPLGHCAAHRRPGNFWPVLGWLGHSGRGNRLPGWLADQAQRRPGCPFHAWPDIGSAERSEESSGRNRVRQVWCLPRGAAATGQMVGGRLLRGLFGRSFSTTKNIFGGAP